MKASQLAGAPTAERTSPQRAQEGRHAREELLKSLPVTERRVELAGISTTLLEGGRHDPIVLLHGPGEHAVKWFRVIPELVKTNRVIVPDLPGHGGSVVSGGQLDRDRVLEWLGELITLTCSTPPILVGQILGGAIAAHFAAEHGDRVRQMLLVDSLGLCDFEPVPAFGQALMEFISTPNGGSHDRLWQQCAFDLDRLREGLGERWTLLRTYNLDRARDSELKSHQNRLMELFGLHGMSARMLARISPPTTLIWGRHDLATPLQTAEKTAEQFGWPLHVIEDAADDPPLEQPDAFLAAIRIVVEQ